MIPIAAMTIIKYNLLINMKLKALLLLVLSVIYAESFAQASSEVTIRQLLQKQTECWNKGDIDGFMQTYWKSDSLLYVGKNGMTYGWQKTLDRYKKSYPDKTAMGQLQFTIIKIQALSPVVYNVVGKWHLARTTGDLEGHYTLIIKKLSGKWLIVQDHSS